MEIKLEKIFGANVQALLQQHLDSMHEQSPPASVHALDLDVLKADNISFWCAWDGQQLMGCGALKRIDGQHGEIKSMRSADNYLRQGVAASLLKHLLAEAAQRHYARVSLETGSTGSFNAARSLYQRFGFTPCSPFDAYAEDPNSYYMSLVL